MSRWVAGLAVLLLMAAGTVTLWPQGKEEPMAAGNLGSLLVKDGYPASAVGKTWLELSAEDQIAELEWSIDWMEKRNVNAADQRAQLKHILEGAD